MPFQEVQSLDADVVVALGKKDKKTGKDYPKQAEGYYLGNRKVENKRGESTLHFLQTPKGNLGVWGTTDLNRKLGQVIPGTMVRVTSTGTKATPNGDMYTYRVEVDSDNSIPVSASTDDASYAADTDADQEYINNEDSEYTNGQDEDYQQDLALAAAKRKAEVEALLKSKSKKN